MEARPDGLVRELLGNLTGLHLLGRSVDGLLRCKSGLAGPIPSAQEARPQRFHFPNYSFLAVAAAQVLNVIVQAALEKHVHTGLDACMSNCISYMSLPYHVVVSYQRHQ